jgi:hypothetical protein
MPIVGIGDVTGYVSNLAFFHVVPRMILSLAQW